MNKLGRTFVQLACLSSCLLSASLGSLSLTPSIHALDGLYDKYLTLLDDLNQSQFSEPLIIRSQESSNHLQGDIYATMKVPFKLVNTQLSNPRNWCDLLLLHINTKRCIAKGNDGNTQLLVHIGSKNPEELTSATPIEFNYSTALSAPGYLAIVLTAPKGPLGTSNYRLMFESISLSGTSSFVHVSYAYQYGLMGQLAMQTYLGTVGRNKVGFSRIGTDLTQKPIYVGGVRGALERNTMRYYLAVLAYMNAMPYPPTEQAEARLAYWIDAVEKYPLQLHESSRDEYLNMKRAEIERQYVAGTLPR